MRLGTGTVSGYVGRSLIDFSVKNWFFTVWFNPIVWGIGYHRKTNCCKFWLLFGPFEIHQMWGEDDYPEEFK